MRDVRRVSHREKTMGRYPKKRWKVNRKEGNRCFGANEGSKGERAWFGQRKRRRKKSRKRKSRRERAQSAGKERVTQEQRHGFASEKSEKSLQTARAGLFALLRPTPTGTSSWRSARASALAAVARARPSCVTHERSTARCCRLSVAAVCGSSL